MELTVFCARPRLITNRPVSFPAFGAANTIRGQFGRELFQTRPELYHRLFAPPRRETGPSGFADPPRPYVLRTAHLDGRGFAPGDSLEFTVNIFDAELASAFSGVLVERRELSLAAVKAERVRVDFVSPTELKNISRPDFHLLFARLRDRVSALRALYGAGPLAIDFKEMGERSKRVRTIEEKILDVDRQRRSHRTGQEHSIGGFIGHATYEGELGEFLPYLIAGQWTGVGRQTVWGKGELRTTVLA